MKKIILIAISGGSGSGKTTAAKKLQALLGMNECKILSQDSYYKDQSKNFKGDGSINFDHPDAIDFELMSIHLNSLKENKPVQIPIYDFVTHMRKIETELFTPTKYIIVDGTLILSQSQLRILFDDSIFLDLPEETRFSRRLKRDVEQRGRTPEGVHVQFYNLVKPMHDQFVAPSGNYAHYKAVDDEEVKEIIFFLSNKLLTLN